LHLIPILAAETPADLALAPDQLTAAEAEVGAKPCDLRIDVEETVGNMRELDAAREVTRVDVKLAQEAVGLTQSTGDAGHAKLRDLERARRDESKQGVAFSTPTSSNTRRRWRAYNPRVNGRGCSPRGNEWQDTRLWLGPEFEYNNGVFLTLLSVGALSQFFGGMSRCRPS
jgi:hypothetical protein